MQVRKQKLSPDVVKEFNLQKSEEDLNNQNVHRFNHIAQNIKKAAKNKELVYLQGQFRKSILNKSNKQNLDLIKKELIQRESMTRTYKL